MNRDLECEKFVERYSDDTIEKMVAREAFNYAYRLLENNIIYARNDFYNKLPTGDVDTFKLIVLIHNHIEMLDSIIKD